MSLLALSMLCAAGFYGFLCAYAYLGWFHTRDTEQLPFATATLGLTILSLAGAASVDCSVEPLAHVEYLTAMSNLTMVGLGLSLAGASDFNIVLGAGPVRLRQLAYLVGAAFIALALTGNAIDPGAPLPERTLFQGAGHYLLPTTQWMRWVALVGTAVSLVAILYPARRWRRAAEPAVRGDYRLVAAVMTPTLFVPLHDGLCVSGVIDSRLLTCLGALPAVAVVSFVFARRIVRISNALREGTEALRSTHRELRETQRRLVRREELAAVGELSAVIAHEVRNPLAVIKNAVAGLRRPEIRSVDEDTLLDILGEETQRLNRIMHDLLAYARPVRPQRSRLDANLLLRRVVGRASTDQVEVHYNVPDGLAIYGDPELLRQAFVNIVENACQAMSEGGELHIGVVEDEDADGERRLHVAFRDTGPGMAPEVLAKANAPFFTTRPSGTGLGLAIVERVLRSHDGSIQLESAEGVGSTIHCFLPLEPARSGSGLKAPRR